MTTLSQTEGRYLYDSGTVPFFAELLKVRIQNFEVLSFNGFHTRFINQVLLQLKVSLLLLLREKNARDIISMIDWKNLRLYPVPSLIYLIHNNVQFGTLIYVDTSTYQIMGNLKIVTTGILFRCFH